MMQEFRLTYQRAGGKRQYKTFQRYKNLYRYTKKLTSATRTDLQPITLIKVARREVGPWNDYDPTSMINEGTRTWE